MPSNETLLKWGTAVAVLFFLGILILIWQAGK